jgi:pyruvate dehydrogenase E1 component alpha subunit
MTELIGLPLEIEREMYRRMVSIRRFEDHLYNLFLQGAVPGTLHQYQGQEAVAVGVCTALRHDDVIFSTHRPVGHFMARPPDAQEEKVDRCISPMCLWAPCRPTPS